MTVRNVFADFIQIFGDIGNEFVRRRMFALDLLKHFDWRLIRVDDFRGVGKRVLFGF